MTCKHLHFIPLTFLLLTGTAHIAQDCYWQQEANYVMDIDFDVTTHRFNGKQTLKYTNHSPDTLHKVFYHLYFNAFQPGSMMDVRSRTIEDPDPRVGSRIVALEENEIGYHRIAKLEQDGKKTKYFTEGTILVVELEKPILPGETHTFYMEFESQVPLQIRRSGRDSEEGVAYSMSQWYPKMVEYDRDGWHSNPYIGREFHGVFGSFDVTIHIDSAYTIGGTGILQNPQEIGHGYVPQQQVKRPASEKLSWHFKASQVHDFAWAADPDFRHITAPGPNGLELHFFHKKDTLRDRWDKLVPYTVRLFEIMNERFGEYPYKQFSVIQAGDGGMEYPMCTFITAHGSFNGLVSVTVHEAVHSWYYGVLATNESKYPWMDEGFTSYAQNIVLDSLYNRRAQNPHDRAYRNYFAIHDREGAEPLTTHADHYHTNTQYGIAAYSRGNIFLHQLAYIIGEPVLQKTLKRFYREWKFKHPTPDDFKRVAEKESGMELDWYFENWIGTSKAIDYRVKNLFSDKKGTRAILERKGEFPMPLEVGVLNNKDEWTIYYIPMVIMRGEKQSDYPEKTAWKPQADWPWVYPEYELKLDLDIADVKQIVIDPMERMADVNRKDNVYPAEGSVIFKK